MCRFEGVILFVRMEPDSIEKEAAGRNNIPFHSHEKLRNTTAYVYALSLLLLCFKYPKNAGGNDQGRQVLFEGR